MHTLATYSLLRPGHPLRGLIFDMDGTIVDTRAFHMESWRMLVRDRGYGEREYRIAEEGFGKTNWAIFDEWFADGREHPSYEELAAEKEKDFRELIRGHVRPRPGFRRLLRLAERRNIKVALATSGPKENALFLLRELGVLRSFDAVLWGTAEVRSKPNPDPFLTAAQRLNVLPSQCIVFEDSPHGLLAARRAGTGVIGIAERPEDLNAVRKWTPYCFRDFRPVVDLLEGRSPNGYYPCHAPFIGDFGG